MDSAQSAAEQAQLQQGGGGNGEREGEMLAQLNEEYERVFPGLRFVVWVNGRGRGEIMGIMRERIEKGTWEGERDGAVEVSFSFIHYGCISLGCFVRGGGGHLVFANSR